MSKKIERASIQEMVGYNKGYIEGFNVGMHKAWIIAKLFVNIHGLSAGWYIKHYTIDEVLEEMKKQEEIKDAKH